MIARRRVEPQLWQTGGVRGPHVDLTGRRFQDNSPFTQHFGRRPSWKLVHTIPVADLEL